MRGTERLERFESLARERRRLEDTRWITLVRDHRWAVGQLARVDIEGVLRSRLNAAVLSVHARLHAGARRAEASRLATGLRRVATPFLVAWVVFLGAALLAAAAVAAQPLTVYAVVPREMLGQIAEHAWGQRESARADAGMTLFYSANNSRACLLALGLGALGGVPGYAVLAYNGALLGAVSGHALHLGLLPNLLAWLGPHGVPELTAIMLSGAIGWVLASAWMRPGSERRATRLAETGQDMAPLIGAAVFLVLAAAPLEGFISPLPLPLWVDGLIALGWISVLVFAVGRTLMLDSRSP